MGVLDKENGDDDSTGGAYVFTDGDDGWTEAAKLTGLDLLVGADFGRSVGIDRDGATVPVGAPGDTGANGDSAGAVCVLEADQDGWGQRVKLSAENGDDGAVFGSTVALSRNGERAIIGAPPDEDPNGSGDGHEPGAGSAYVFE